jgi:hypothetical protein
MKKYILIFFATAAILSSCHYEDIEPSYTTIVLFWHQEYNRNIVVGEGLKFSPGIILGGVIDNEKDRLVKFVIDPSLVTNPSKTVLPASYYTLSHPTDIVIKKGDHLGFLNVKMDSAAFLADPKSLTGEYVLPIRITGSNDVDSVNAVKDHLMMYISYWAKQHGNYNYSGQAVKKSGGTVVETLQYSDFLNVANSIRSFTTVGPTTLKLGADMTSASKDPAKNKYSFYVTLASLGGGNVTISSDPASSIAVQPNGVSTYDAANKTFTLNYKYIDGVNEVEVSETMVFRNRIRDVNNGQGVNEWRDIP